ncbi:MAG: ribose 5-phosphate isomerase B [Oscillospiraceae bacterium]|nr:ribose 5-phosphate isomerase B [Oscillospiraceae bacterium]
MIALACDHGGYVLMQAVKKHLDGLGLAYRDFGTWSEDSCDYPDYAAPAARAVASGDCDRGILICGTGIGIAIAANKIRGIRAATCSDCFSAEATRRHNDANMLAMGARVLGEGLALKIVDIFLSTPFEGGRHQRRIDKIAALESDPGQEARLD